MKHNYTPKLTTYPTRLLELAVERAATLPPGTFAAYLVSLIRADLAEHGVELPEPPPPRQNGRKPKR